MSTIESGNQQNLDLLLDNPHVPLHQAHYPKAFASIGLFQPDITLGNNVEREYWLSDVKLFISGPELSLYDEDTLIAILQLCNQFRTEKAEDSNKLAAMVQRHNMQNFKQLLTDDSEKASDLVVAGSFLEVTLRGTMSLYTINNYLGLKWGGKSKTLRSASIDRLSRIDISSSQEKNGKIIRSERDQLLKVKTIESSSGNDIQYVFTISSMMVNLLTNYVQINLELRGKLTTSGKLLHRYLVSEGFPERQEPLIIEYSNIQKRAGFSRPWRKYKVSLFADEGDLFRFKEYNFVKDISFSGLGRKGNPIKLEIYPIIKG